MSLGTAFADEGEQRVGIIAAIGDDVAALEAREQMWRGAQIVGLACRQHEAQGQAALVNCNVDLGA